MPKNKFYIVRHAESENNLLELESSKIENKDQFGLTEKGRSHTESEASAFKCFDFVYTSPFRRAVETAQIFAMTSGKEVIVDNSLREVDVGDYELHPYHEVESYLQEHGEGLPYPNGESMAAARDRAINFLRQVDQKHVDDHILIVTHGDIVLFLIEHLDANFDRKKAIEHYNHDSSRKVVGPIVSEPENGPGVARIQSRSKYPNMLGVMPMTSKRKNQIYTLLKGIETGDPAAVAVVNPNKYIQHNPETHEGGEGLAALFKRLSKSEPRVNLVRVFEDGDYVFAHTEYDFASLKIGFEVFRFEGDLTVEHWDNIQEIQGPNPSGHTMIDGPTTATDLDQTESNREIVRSFVDDILIKGHLERLEDYIDNMHFTQHSPQVADGLSALRSALTTTSDKGIAIKYDRLHRLLAEGSFVLAVSEGALNGVHSSFYDLFRVSEGKLVEHWDTIETVPPRSEWKNDNGKF